MNLKPLIGQERRQKNLQGGGPTENRPKPLPGGRGQWKKDRK